MIALPLQRHCRELFARNSDQHGLAILTGLDRERMLRTEVTLRTCQSIEPGDLQRPPLFKSFENYRVLGWSLHGFNLDMAIQRNLDLCCCGASIFMSSLYFDEGG